jgi:hypothetical protein
MKERPGLEWVVLSCLALTLPDKAREDTRQEVDLEREIKASHFFRGRLFCPLVRVSPIDLHLASTERKDLFSD